MSKIHEALRKAQEEKSQAASCETRPKAEEHPKPAVQEQAQAAFALPGNVPSQGGHHRSFSGQYLRFEDLLKQCAEPIWQLDPNAIVFSGSYGPANGAEQFRTLRTRIYHFRETHPLKKVLVTSAIAAEGKTFVATNLAQAFACERNRRVLLIDGDLRSPRLHLPLGAPISPGLAEYLRDEASEAEIIQHGREGNLCFIAGGKGGRENPSELLSNGRLQKLLDRITPLFDWVVIDSTPCLPVADASVLSTLCDGLLLVVKAKSTPLAAVQRAGHELRKRNIIGVVLNAVDESDSYGAYYAYPYSGSDPKAKNENTQ